MKRVPCGVGRTMRHHVLLVVGLAACGGSPPAAGRAGAQLHRGSMTSLDGPCGDWQPAEQLCACLSGHRLAVDAQTEAYGEDDEPAPPSDPPTCSGMPDAQLAWVREGADEYQTLWLVERRGALVRAATAPVAGQVQDRRHTTDLRTDPIGPMPSAGADVLAARFGVDEYDAFVASEPTETATDHLVLCQPVGDHLACLAPIVVAWHETATRPDPTTGDDQVLERRVRIELHVDADGTVRLSPDGELPASVRQADPPQRLARP